MTASFVRYLLQSDKFNILNFLANKPKDWNFKDISWHFGKSALWCATFSEPKSKYAVHTNDSAPCNIERHSDCQQLVDYHGGCSIVSEQDSTTIRFAVVLPSSWFKQLKWLPKLLLHLPLNWDSSVPFRQKNGFFRKISVDVVYFLQILRHSYRAYWQKQQSMNAKIIKFVWLS